MKGSQFSNGFFTARLTHNAFGKRHVIQLLQQSSCENSAVRKPMLDLLIMYGSKTFRVKMEKKLCIIQFRGLYPLEEPGMKTEFPIRKTLSVQLARREQLNSIFTHLLTCLLYPTTRGWGPCLTVQIYRPWLKGSLPELLTTLVPPILPDDEVANNRVSSLWI